MISPRDLDNYRTLIEAQASDAVEIDDDSASATGAWSSSKFASELAKLTAEFSLVTDYQNFAPVTGQPTSANPVVSLPRGSLPENRSLGYWLTVKKHSKLVAVQTIDYGPDSAIIWAGGEFARWTGYIDHTTNGTPGYGLSSTSNSGGFGSQNAKGAFDGSFADHYNNTWDSSAGRYDTSTGAYIMSPPTTTSVIADYGGSGSTAQSVLGEWVQFRFPYEVVINQLRPYAKWTNEFVFAGSMDGVQWYQLAVGTGSQNHWNGISNLASYSFNGTRVRYVRFIITNASNFFGATESLGRASVNELEMYVSTPFARWTGYIDHTTNGTPGYGTSSASKPGGYGSQNGKGAFDGVYSTHYNHIWGSNNGTYSTSTGAYIMSPPTTTSVIADYGGQGYTPQPVLGEWVQFKFPYEVVINQLKPYCAYMSQFVFAGSMDGIQWYQLAVGTGSQNHWNGTSNLASYSFNGTRVRYVRFIITNASNFFGATEPYGKAVVNELEMYTSTPFRRRHLHEIHRLDYLNPTFGNVALRPSETDRVAALDPANSASLTLSLIKEFHTEELSREGNVATHREVDVTTGAPLDFSDPVYKLEPGYYYIVTKLPAYDSGGEVVREGGWAISLAADILRKHVGVDHTGVKSLFSGDTAGGQVSTPGLKTALAMGSTTQLGPIVYPYVLANYRFQRVKP